MGIIDEASIQILVKTGLAKDHDDKKGYTTNHPS
jgi:hypothetical protein